MRELRTGATAPVSLRIPELTLTLGLPASGKSTWAAAQQAAAPDRIRIVNRDDIRASLGTRFEDNDEPLVAGIRDFMIRTMLIAGYHVICSDTNLSPKVQRRLMQIAKTVKARTSVQDFRNVSLDVCLARNAVRWQNGDCKVPDSAIVKMHEEFINPVAEPANQEVG